MKSLDPHAGIDDAIEHVLRDERQVLDRIGAVERHGKWLGRRKIGLAELADQPSNREINRVLLKLASAARFQSQSAKQIQ
jgi:hypothetical protein